MIPYGDRILIEFVDERKGIVYKPEFRGCFKRAVVKVVGSLVHEIEVGDKIFTKRFKPVIVDDKEYVLTKETNIPAKYE